MPVLPLLFDANHPVFAGHFPGHPIVPGVLLLEWTQTAIEAHIGKNIDALVEAKFHSPVLPSDALELHFEVSSSAVRFEIKNAGRKTASGRYTLSIGAEA